TSRDVYVTVLRKEDGSPLAPESDEEKAAANKDADSGKDKETAKDKTPPEVHIDLAGIDQRILALPIPAREYMSLDAGKTGILFLTEKVQNPAAPPEDRDTATLYKFDLKTRKTDKVLEDLKRFAVSRDGEKLLYEQGKNWIISGSATPPKPGDGVL